MDIVFFVLVLLVAAGGAWFLVRRRASGPATVDFAAMQWQAFESRLSDHFWRSGYHVEKIDESDADLRLTREGKTWYVNAKYWDAGHVGAEPVRQVMQRVAGEDAAGGFVVTSGQFTADARQLAARAEIELIEGPALAEALARRG